MNLYNQFCEYIILPFFDKINGGHLSSNYQNWKKFDKYSSDELNFLQKENLRKLLVHAKDNIPFYKDFNININADPYEEVKKLPLMYKPIIKENIDLLTFGSKENYMKEASSGSSGVQGIVYIDKESQSMHRSIQLHWWHWAGYNPGDKIVQTGATLDRKVIKALKDFLFRTKYISAYHLDKNSILKVLDDMSKKSYKHLLGYASSLFVIAKIAKENNINNIKLDSVVSWGDKMFPHFRQLIESQFNTKVYDTYACTEGAMIAGQCPQGSYHIMIPQVYLEVLDENGQDVKPGELGKVYVTRLDNLAMPLIRYYLGDLVELESPDKKCTCGMNYPLLKRVIGRDTDIVKTASGKYMIVHSFTGIFEHIPEIAQFRVIQRDLNGIEIEYIKGQNFNPEILNQITIKIHNYLDESFPIDFKEVDSIPSTKSGKPQLIQSFLNQSNNVNQSV